MTDWRRAARDGEASHNALGTTVPHAVHTRR